MLENPAPAHDPLVLDERHWNVNGCVPPVPIEVKLTLWPLSIVWGVDGAITTVNCGLTMIRVFVEVTVFGIVAESVTFRQ